MGWEPGSFSSFCVTKAVPAPNGEGMWGFDKTLGHTKPKIRQMKTLEIDAAPEARERTDLELLESQLCWQDPKGEGPGAASREAGAQGGLCFWSEWSAPDWTLFGSGCPSCSLITCANEALLCSQNAFLLPGTDPAAE